MAAVYKTVLVGFSAEQMFALVDRVEDYPRFLPWCGGSEVKHRDADSVVASLAINFHGIKQTFTTSNKNVYPHSIKLHLVDGPFRQLEGSWVFKPLRADACKIEFELNYEFSSKILDKIIGPVFNKIANSFVDSFCKQAEIIYG
jgi:ribosome-associated toxin RatA of RatAB toxin-antitoxin module